MLGKALGTYAVLVGGYVAVRLFTVSLGYWHHEGVESVLATVLLAFSAGVAAAASAEISDSAKMHARIEQSLVADAKARGVIKDA